MAALSRLPGLMAEARRVVIVKPSSLGDIVHTLPAVYALRRQWPHLHLSWVVNTEFAPLLEGHPDLNAIVEFPRSSFRGWRGIGRFRSWLEEYRIAARADVALDFQGLLRSGLISRASGARTIVGLDDSREGARFFHHMRVDSRGGQPRGSAPLHAVQRYLCLAAACDGYVEPPLVYSLPSGEAPEALRPHLPLQPWVLLHPFSRGKDKSLAPELVTRLCTLLAPMPVILAGRCDPTHMQGQRLPENAIDLLNATTLPGLVWLMRGAHSVISVDSGPMHIAAALTPNVLGLHTWSDPRRVGPANAGASVWKGGHIMPCANLDPAICASPGRPFQERDLLQWAQWVGRVEME